MSINLLEIEFPVLDVEEQIATKGGGDGDPYDPNYWNGDPNGFNWLPAVIVGGGGSSSSPSSSGGYYGDGYYGGIYYGGSYYSSGYYGGYYTGGGGGGGSDPSNSGSATGFPVMDYLGLATSNGLMWHEFYAGVQAAADGRLMTDLNAIVKATFTQNPYSQIATDTKALLNNGTLNGIQILDNAGRILGVTGAVSATFNLVDKLTNPYATVTWTDWADAGINIGALFIKSNIVGFTVSAGWFMIESWIE